MTVDPNPEEMMVNNVPPPAAPPPLSDGTQLVVMLSAALLYESPHNPRKTFSESDLLAFGMELKQHGVKTPLRVMKRGERYEIVAGARRFRAAKLVGIETLPCIVGPELSPTELRIDQLLDNQHDSLTVVDRAACYQELMRDNGWNGVTLAGVLNCSESKISKALAVKSSLVADVQALVREGKLGAALAYELAKCPVETQRKLSASVVGREVSEAEAKASIARMGKGKRPGKATVGFELTTFETVRQRLEALLTQVAKLEKAGMPVTALKTLWR